LEDLIYFVLDILLFHGELNAYDELNIDGIYVDIESLLMAYHRDASPADGHTVLIVGKSCVSFPWESMPCLRNRSVSRMQSLHVLEEQLQHPLMVSREKCGYVLNPGGDLNRTEDNFSGLFEEIGDGIVGRRPSEAEFSHLLAKADVFLYLGHGSGDQYISSQTLKRQPRIAPSLLIGCSSGALTTASLLEPHGTVYNYLAGGCPMVLVNLWDVTDKDIDTFSLSLFEKWGLVRGSHPVRANICEAVCQSRDVCKLRFLNGAAPIVYGLPL
ncbi:hypothetical protein BABINDRAFT_17995, partial [Babjeviella inositovora NRRL Y-12698]